MAAWYSKTLYFEGADEKRLRDVCKRAVHQLGFRLKPEDGSGNIVAKASFSLRSWGEIIKITFSASSGLVVVEFYSECRLFAQFIDWGKNKKNVESIVELLKKEVPK